MAVTHARNPKHVADMSIVRVPENEHLSPGRHEPNEVPQDDGKAREWYAKAAAAGNPHAMLNLGFLYAAGKGVPQDYEIARQWFERGASAGENAAMLMLGDLYEAGLGVSQNHQKAREWYEKAAAAGNPEAQERLKKVPIP